jgi:pimeloyl-ACP methyl ester carboxylesterase
MDRECEDISAVLGAAGEGAALVGHSFGAICSLETAMRKPVRRLVLYEPPLPAGGPIAGDKHAAYAEAIARGDLDGALELGLEHFSRIPVAEIAALRNSRAWQRLRTLAPSWVRELEVMDALSAGVEHYRTLGCPAMLLVGSESPEHPLLDASRALAGVLSSARVEILAGEGHVAMRTAPELVAGLIGEFVAV